MSIPLQDKAAVLSIDVASDSILMFSQLAGTSDAVANLKTKNWELRKELITVSRDRDNLRRLLNRAQ